MRHRVSKISTGTLAATAGVVLALGAAPANAWRTSILPGAGRPTLGAADGRGNVVVALGRPYARFAFMTRLPTRVASLGSDGSYRWQRSLGLKRHAYIAALAVDVDANAFVAVSTGSGTTLIRALDRRGRRRWSRDVVLDGYPVDLRVDAAGKVLVQTDAQVTQLAGATGAERWQWTPVGQGQPLSLRVAPDGQVIAASGTGLVALAGATGLERWRYDVALRGIDTGPSGDVFVAGELADHTPVVRRLDRADGSVRWSTAYPEGRASFASRLAIDPDGDVIAQGNPALRKLSGGDGHVLWTLDSPGDFPTFGVFLPGGDLLFAGRRESDQPAPGTACRRFFASHLAGASGTALSELVLDGGFTEPNCGSASEGGGPAPLDVDGASFVVPLADGSVAVFGFLTTHSGRPRAIVVRHP